MALPTSKTDSTVTWLGRVVAHHDIAAHLGVQQETHGDADMPRNAGNRRTASKRELLKALDNLGAIW